MREPHELSETPSRVPPRQWTPGAQKQTVKYWAFLSYSRRDEKWVTSLHRKLESFHIPKQTAPAAGQVFPPGDRFRPVFRDHDELAVASNLSVNLTAALDDSRFLVLVASQASAGSGYVEAEVRHMVDTGRAEDIRIIALESDVDQHVPLPPALASYVEDGREPLWLDARGTSKPTRRSVVRLVAGMLGISFDTLWRRDRRRRRQQFLAVAAAVLLLATVVSVVMLRQRTAAENIKPERQVAAFRAYLTDTILTNVREDDPEFPESKLDFEILRTDDLNGDSLIDFFVINRTLGFCGSGGCSTDAYLTEGVGKYRIVADLFSASTPRTRAVGDGAFREILTTEHSVDAEPVYSIFRWNGRKYEISHYEFCSGVSLEYCDDPLQIMPVPREKRTDVPVTDDIRFLVEPDLKAPTVRIVEGRIGSYGSVIGQLDGGAWFLVDVWKSESAFVHRSDIER